MNFETKETGERTWFLLNDLLRKHQIVKQSSCLKIKLGCENVCVYVFVSEWQIDKHTKRERGGEDGRETDRKKERQRDIGDRQVDRFRDRGDRG